MSSVMRRLADRHEIHFLTDNGRPQAALTIYPTNPKGGDAFAAFQAKRLIEEIRPALVLVMHDIWMFDYYLSLFGPYRDRLKVVACIPLDGRIANEEEAAPLAQADRIVAYTQFAREEFEGAFRRLREKQADRDFPAVDVIPHGVDRDRFYPFPELEQASFASTGRAQAKRRVFGDRPDAGESFVVLNASRPDKRKRVDLTVRGFAMFAAGKPANVRLCLHHPIMRGAAEPELGSVIRECGLGERVSVNPLGSQIVGDDELNLLYNACDIGINTAMGEGWGLVSFEHGAAGAAQIVPDHTACAELWRGHAELSPEGVAQALETLYRDPARRQELARAAVSVAQNPAYSWDVVARQFDDLVVGLADGGEM